MWNYNLRQGTIWSVKSMNSYEEHYEGMTFGESLVLILSVYTDVSEIEKFTYLKIDKVIRNNFYTYEIVESSNNIYNINLNSIYTADRRSLENYVDSISTLSMKRILNTIKTQFNFFSKNKSLTNKSIKSKTKVKVQTKINTFNKDLTTINKYGLTVRFKPSKHITLNRCNNRFIFSEEFKNDAMLLSAKDVSNKYSIFPEQAVKIIRSKLVYNKNHR